MPLTVFLPSTEKKEEKLCCQVEIRDIDSNTQ